MWDGIGCLSQFGRVAGMSGAACTFLLAGASFGQVQFTNVNDEAGIGPYQMAYGMSGGVAAADYDNDGDIDLYAPNGFGVANQLYRNLGNGQFEEIASDVGLASPFSDRAALWIDYDGDADLDLLVAGDCWHAVGKCLGPTSIRLYEQISPDEFIDRTATAGLENQWLVPDGSHLGGLCAGDINNDGYLDFMLSGWDSTLHLFLNNTRGKFLDISVSSGVGEELSTHWQPIMADFNNDGWQDIYVVIDFWDNKLFINQHDNTFIEMAAEAGLNNDMNDMGVTLGDYDNDGDLDIYITNIFEEDAGGQEYNMLYRNDSVAGELIYTDVSLALGVADGRWGWGATFFDADNDGWLDIAATNGWFEPSWIGDPSKFFLNLGGGPQWFAEVSDAVGFNDTYYGSCLIAFDYDADGDLDLTQSCNNNGDLHLLANNPVGSAADNSYLLVRPRMDGPNHRAIGAIVHVEAGELSMMRMLTAGTSHLGQEPAEAFFGLGENTIVQMVAVAWPDGEVTTLSNVQANRIITVTPNGNGGDLNADGVVGSVDLAIVLGNWGPCGAGAIGCPGDADGDGVAGSADLAVVLGNWG